MLELSARNFGLLIAYVIPGFIALWGLSLVSEPVRFWLMGAGETGPAFAGVFYLLLASVAAGMTASAIRWALLDTLHHRTGITRPAWDDTRLNERIEAYQFLIDSHYRYYQFYGNTLASMAFSEGIRVIHGGWRLGWIEAGMLFIGAIFFAASRDALTKYHRRSTLLLGTQKEPGETMTNGAHHDSGGAATTTPKTKPQATQESGGAKNQAKTVQPVAANKPAK